MIEDPDELETAVAQDQARRQRVDENKARAVANGDAIYPSPEMASMVSRGRILQAELAGYKQLSQEARTNSVATIGPKLKEYVSLRVELAMLETVNGIAHELGIPPAEVAAIIGSKVAETEVRKPKADLGLLINRSLEAAAAGQLEQAEQLATIAERLHKLI